jgi:hypothetical protein
MKYTLIAEDTWDGSKTTREFEVDALPEVLSEVELFLRGAGFFFDGNLDFVNDFENIPNWDEEDFQEIDYDAPHVGEMYDSMNLPSNNWPFAVPAPHPKAPDEWTQTLREDAIAEGHSHYYFDTERNK